MSFINWDHETPEQRAFRRKLEEQALFQQAMAKKLFEQKAAANAASAASAGAAGSSGNVTKK